MQLVEIIRGHATSENTYQLTKALAETGGKTTVCSQDYPGFIVNRILMPMINEAFLRSWKASQPLKISTRE